MIYWNVLNGGFRCQSWAMFEHELPSSCPKQASKQHEKWRKFEWSLQVLQAIGLQTSQAHTSSMFFSGWLLRGPRACMMDSTWVATTLRTSNSIRLNSSKQPHKPLIPGWEHGIYEWTWKFRDLEWYTNPIPRTKHTIFTKPWVFWTWIFHIWWGSSRWCLVWPGDGIIYIIWTFEDCFVGCWRMNGILVWRSASSNMGNPRTIERKFEACSWDHSSNSKVHVDGARGCLEDHPA